MHVRRLLARRALALGALLALAVTTPALAQTADYTATQIRQIEDSGVFTPPTPQADFVVGKWDVATNTFTGTKTGQKCHYDIELRMVVCEPGPPPQVTVNGVRIGFTVRWSGASGSVTVTANGISKTVPAGNGSVTIDVNRATQVDWRIVANGRSYGDEVVIKRPRIVGAGVFTIKALPIGIAYEPPQDPGKLNNNTYKRVTTTATSLISTIQTSSGTTAPKASSSVSFTSLANGLGSSVGGTAGAALQKIGSLVGEMHSDVTTSQVEKSTTAVNVQLVNRRTCTTGDHLGPGGGDKIVYLKNARVAWISDNKDIYLSLLGSNGASCMSVNALKNGTSGFDAATAQSLLSVDPLAIGGPNTFLPPDRFTYLYDIDLDPTTTNNPDTDSHTESRWASLGTTTTTTNVTTDTMKAGLLAFLGVGPAQSQTTTVSVESKNERVEGSGTEITTEATLRTLRLGLTSTIRAYYDRVFATIVYRAT